jgi:uncharacterized protein
MHQSINHSMHQTINPSINQPMNQPAAFTVGKERILSVDVLRGFALFGILYSHMIVWYAAGALPEQYFRADYGVLSMVAFGSYFLLFMGKFFSIFSFLFGLSFYLQLHSLSKYSNHPVAHFAWRLAILGLIGLAHHTFWRADILSIYVPLGFLLIFFRTISNKALLLIGCLLVLNIPTLVMQLANLVLYNHYDLLAHDLKVESAAYFKVITQDNFLEMCRGNLLGTYDKLVYQINSGRLLITFGFFLLGMWVGRLGWFNSTEIAQQKARLLFGKSWKAILLLIALGIVGGVSFGVAKVDIEKTPWAQYPFIVLFNFINIALTLLYITSIVLLMNKEKWIKRFAPLAGIGKMALTTYLTQSIVGVFLFFHVGFGLFGKTTPAQNIGICMVIFALQIIFSTWWLKRFYYGPVEWLWRSATFLKWQPLIKH